MNLADFFGALHFYAEIPDKEFETFEVRCRSHEHRQEPSLFRLNRSELIGCGATVIYFPFSPGDPPGKWGLAIPFAGLDFEILKEHLFHELETVWDHRWIGLRPLSVQRFPSGVQLLPLPTRGSLPMSREQWHPNPGLDCECGGKLHREPRPSGAVMVCDRCHQ